MEQLLTGIPLISLPAGIVIVVGAVIYLFSRIRKQDMKILRESNDDLRQRDKDRTKELDEMKRQIHELEDKVEHLEKRNKTLEDLVVVALKQYFFENPTMAGQIKKSLK